MKGCVSMVMKVIMVWLYTTSASKIFHHSEVANYPSLVKMMEIVVLEHFPPLKPILLVSDTLRFLDEFLRRNKNLSSVSHYFLTDQRFLLMNDTLRKNPRDPSCDSIFLVFESVFTLHYFIPFLMMHISPFETVTIVIVSPDTDGHLSSDVSHKLPGLILINPLGSGDLTGTASFGVWTFLPYSGSPRQKKVLVDQWTGLNFVHRNRIAALPDSLADVELLVTAFQYPPYVIYSGQGSPTLYDGIDVKLFGELTRRLKFVPNFTSPQDKMAWKGMKKVMKSKQADIALGGIFYFVAGSQPWRFLTPHSFDYIAFIVPYSRHFPYWKALILPFTSLCWSLVVVAATLGSVVLNLIAHSSMWLLPHHAKPTMYVSLQLCFIHIFSILCQVSLHRRPHMTPMRILIGFWWIFGLLLTVIYISKFLAILNAPPHDKAIETVEQLGLTNLRIGGSKNSKVTDMVRSFGIPRVSEKIEKVSVAETLPKVAKNLYAIVNKCNYLEFVSSTRFLHNDGRKKTGVLKERLAMYPVGLAVQNNSPLVSIINPHVRKIVEAGLISVWSTWIVRTYKDKRTQENDEDENVLVLTNAHLAGCYKLLGIGICASVVVFAGELFRSCFNAWRLQRQSIHAKKTTCTRFGRVKDTRKAWEQKKSLSPPNSS